MLKWHPATWQKKPIEQPIDYADANQLADILRVLEQREPLVTPAEINQLKNHLAIAAKGECFLLQAGDCAENFSDNDNQIVARKLDALKKITQAVYHKIKLPVVTIGRIAGQYAKPRSQATETRGQITLPSFRGELINSPQFGFSERSPDPQRLLQAYDRSAYTINCIRSLLNNEGGNFEFYSSHEGLHLAYEQALTRQDQQGKWYNLSTHFPWIGMRTADPSCAHVEYFRGISNPIAVKIGPMMTTQSISELAMRLNPHNEPGRLSFIHRLGADKIATLLPGLINAVHKTGIQVLWLCDPMHANTTTTPTGIKTRYTKDIFSELKQAFSIHQRMQSHLGGIHFEFTHENVTECLEDRFQLQNEALKPNYTSLVDPRLNLEQTQKMISVLNTIHDVSPAVT